MAAGRQAPVLALAPLLLCVALLLEGCIFQVDKHYGSHDCQTDEDHIKLKKGSANDESEKGPWEICAPRPESVSAATCTCPKPKSDNVIFCQTLVETVEYSCLLHCGSQGCPEGMYCYRSYEFFLPFCVWKSGDSASTSLAEFATNALGQGQYQRQAGSIRSACPPHQVLASAPRLGGLVCASPCRREGSKDGQDEGQDECPGATARHGGGGGGARRGQGSDSGRASSALELESATASRTSLFEDKSTNKKYYTTACERDDDCPSKACVESSHGRGSTTRACVLQASTVAKVGAEELQSATRLLLEPLGADVGSDVHVDSDVVAGSNSGGSSSGGASSRASGRTRASISATISASGSMSFKRTASDMSGR